MPFSTIADIISSLALVLVLESAYSAIYRRITHNRSATDAVLGVLFGMVTLFQMHRPFEPVEGLIIDLRNVPIVLAGAFLGWPGLLACLGIAVATRLHVGGVGMVAGVLAMGIVAVIGRVWRNMTCHQPTRGRTAYLLLGLSTSLSLGAAVIMPLPIMVLFLKSAGLWLAAVYAVVVPAAAWLLDHETRRLIDERHLRHLADNPMPDRTLHWGAFRKQISHIVGAGDAMLPSGLLHIAVRNRGWLRARWGTDTLDLAHGAIRLHLDDICPHHLGKSYVRDGGLLVALNGTDMHRSADITRALERAMGDEGIVLQSAAKSRVQVDVTVVPTVTAQQLTDALDDLEQGTLPATRKARQNRATTHGPGSAAMYSTQTACPSGHAASLAAMKIQTTQDDLFDRAGQMIADRDPSI